MDEFDNNDELEIQRLTEEDLTEDLLKEVRDASKSVKSLTDDQIRELLDQANTIERAVKETEQQIRDEMARLFDERRSNANNFSRAASSLTWSIESEVRARHIKSLFVEPGWYRVNTKPPSYEANKETKTVCLMYMPKARRKVGDGLSKTITGVLFSQAKVRRYDRRKYRGEMVSMGWLCAYVKISKEHLMNSYSAERWGKLSGGDKIRLITKQGISIESFEQMYADAYGDQKPIKVMRGFNGDLSAFAKTNGRAKKTYPIKVVTQDNKIVSYREFTQMVSQMSNEDYSYEVPYHDVH